MRLSEVLIVDQEAEIQKDGEFNRLAFLEDYSCDAERILCFVINEEYLKKAELNNHISCIIGPKSCKSAAQNSSKSICLSETPKHTFFSFHNYLAKVSRFYGEEKSTVINSTANIHPTAYIADTNVVIEKNVFVGPKVVIHKNVTLRENACIRSGAVIGDAGFCFYRLNNAVLPITCTGKVDIGQNCEIQANTCIDRGRFGGTTLVGEQTKIDNLTYIAHDAVIGKRCIVCANTLVLGRVVIGNDAYIGPSSSIRNGLVIGNAARVSLGAVVTKNVADGETVTGNFAVEHNRFIEEFKSRY